MKKQHRTYLLLAIVLLVWGIIGYRFVNALNPSKEDPQVITTNERFVPKKIKKREDFSLVADYRDPFLGTVKTPTADKKKPVPKPIQAKVPKKNIVYTGFISDQGTVPNIFFVTIEGQQEMMSLNDTFQEVKLIKGTKSYITVSYNGSSEKISLNP
ncbi:hypothetical protein MAR621_03045 [Maribacter dokdonensis]|uniref:hypothetical protein n=1 Tax=Maribacter dokdonensis TaxID=320912 RepID=UPI001B2F0B08|nr:hypothetical protein [Maribacter dokdonensis]CAG2532851.1 hypothetical protein MAR621_03045 [Maribacter dokdonensis]